MLNEESNIKRRRVARACDSCRRKKVRCDSIQTGSDLSSCTNCKTYGYECSFIDAPKKRGPPRGYIEALEARLQRMESVLENLVQPDELPEDTIDSNFERINVNKSNLQSSQGFADKSCYSQKSFDPSTSRTSQLPNTCHVNNNKSHRGQNSDNEDDDYSDLTNNLGYMAIDGSRELTRYIGNTSGMMSLMRTSIHIRSGQFLPIPIEHTRASVSRIVVQNAISKLPPKELCDQLLDIFWKHAHYFAFFIDKLDFMEKYNNLETNYLSIILLYAIFAIASLKLDIPTVRTDSNDPSTTGMMYFERARELLRDELEQPESITIIQALLLLSTYHRSAKNSLSWFYTGTAIRIAQAMGLYRDSSNWNFTAREIEIRKRVWWACVADDICMCTVHGRPLVISEVDCDVKYPNFGVIPEESPSFVEGWNEMIKINLILKRILKRVYSLNSKQSLTSNRDTVLSSLDTELNEWYKKLPSGLQCEASSPYNGQEDLQRLHLHILYYTSQILLHRPHIRGPKSKAPNSSIPSLTICTMAANKITNITNHLIKKESLGFIWALAMNPFLIAMTMHFINIFSGDDRFREITKCGIKMSFNCLNNLKHYCFVSKRIIHFNKQIQIIEDIINGVNSINNINSSEGISSSSDGERLDHLQNVNKDRVPIEESNMAHTAFASSKTSSQIETTSGLMNIVNQPTSNVSNAYNFRDCNSTKSVNSLLSPLMNYEQISSPESTSSNSSLIRLNNGLFPPNANSFISDESQQPHLFNDYDNPMDENNSFLSLLFSNDWTNWTRDTINSQKPKTSDTSATDPARNMFSPMTGPGPRNNEL